MILYILLYNPIYSCQIFRACPTVFEKNLTDPSCEESVVNVSESSLVVKSEERGLADLVRQCLGKPLNKQQQMSDWEKRPLRPQQITYAGNHRYSDYICR